VSRVWRRPLRDLHQANHDQQYWKCLSEMEDVKLLEQEEYAHGNQHCWDHKPPRRAAQTMAGAVGNIIVVIVEGHD